MESAQLSTTDSAQQTPQSATSTTSSNSPAQSLFSKGHASRSSGSTSSLTSSPTTRDSLDLFGSTKRLEDVREDPQEREEDGYDLMSDTSHYFLDNGPGPARMSFEPSLSSSPPLAHYGMGEMDSGSAASSARNYFKRQRSVEYARNSVANRIVSRLPSISKRWKHRSGAGPQLSIVTHVDPTASRTSSGTSSQLISPALSAISKHESYLPTSPNRPSTEIGSPLSMPLLVSPEPMNIAHKEEAPEENQAAATTPLLPPVFTQLATNDSPIQSPLQSPSVAAATAFPVNTTPISTPIISNLPSPPLSTKPSLASMGQRSRANTTNLSTSDIPPLQMLDESKDPWAQRLGHANFAIHPEPYAPPTIDLESYREFRTNWDLARTNYAKHLARTVEHYGDTSKVYLLTQEKWEAIDLAWKRHNKNMTPIVNPLIARISDGDAEMTGSMESSGVLEKPVTRVVVPKLDDSGGKFPELGDEDIIGPMSVAPARTMTVKKRSEREPSPQSPRKRTLFKFLSELLNGGKSSRT